MSYKERLLAEKQYLDLIDELFDILEEKGLSRYRISKDTGIDQTRLSRIYNDKVPMSMNEFITISSFYNISVFLKGVETQDGSIVKYITGMFSSEADK